MCATCDDGLVKYREVQRPARIIRDEMIDMAHKMYENKMWFSWHEYAEALESCRNIPDRKR